MRRAQLVVALALLVACRPQAERLTIFVTPDDEVLFRDGIAFMGDARVRLEVVSRPGAALASAAGAAVAVEGREDCAECYRLEGSGTRLVVRGGAPLGKQYGLWHSLETLGYRFVHPWHTKMPEVFTSAPADALGQDFSPEVDLRRGLHLHTLHPTESLYDFWLPGEANLEGALRTVDFVVKNRGNYVQWCGLDDIMRVEVAEPWRAHTRAITDFAHARGVRTGIAIQLFGKSNLQNAFDLIDDDAGDVVPEMERRLRLLLDGAGFDAVNLSFGEFFGAEPARFVQEVDSAYRAMQRVQPGVEVMATIHVGNYDDLRITYMGEEQLYYFLVRYADPAIVPWVHTTMYYTLYDDAGLAYLHEEFDEHRAYIEARLRAGEPVGYFPESAYWVAFDINIPTFKPVYVRSRHTDLTRLAQAGRLRDHVLFSSGWEWGYWLTDVATLRMSYRRPMAWRGAIDELFSAWGPAGMTAADLIARLGEAQHRALIVERLAAWVASRDQLIDAGDRLGIFSQPDRLEFREIVGLDAAARAAFRDTVVARLAAHAAEVAALAQEVESLDPADPVFAELRDGVTVTAARVRFIHALTAAAVAHAEGGDAASWLQQADQQLEVARAIVARRRSRLWDPDPKTILRNTPNPTFYQYGYLREADTLCFWVRERAQARNVILQAGEFEPGCVL